MKKEEEFFDKVEEVLQTYTETYEEGAWEDFETHRKKRKRIWLFKPWTAVAAAVILLVVYGLFELTNTVPLTETLAVKKSDQRIPKQTIEKTAIDTLIGVNEVTIVKQFKEHVNPSKIARVNRNESVKVEDDIYLDHKLNNAAIDKTANENQSQKIPNTVEVIDEKKERVAAVTAEAMKNGIEKKTPVVTANKFSAGAYDSLVNRNIAVTAAKSNDRSFTYAVVVSPSLSNQKVNFGAGMEVSYKLGGRFSINSGVIYNELNAKSGGKSLSSASQFAQNADLAVSGIEIPLGLQYQINNGFYAAIGVSGMGLLSNRLEYSYQEDRVASMPVINSNGTEHIIRLFSEQKTAQAKEDLNNYIGFFTISAGKKQAFGNSNLNIGPFFKIPFNSISTEKIKLLQGGFKFSLDF